MSSKSTTMAKRMPVIRFHRITIAELPLAPLFSFLFPQGHSSRKTMENNAQAVAASGLREETKWKALLLSLDGRKAPAHGTSHTMLGNNNQGQGCP